MEKIVITWIFGSIVIVVLLLSGAVLGTCIGAVTGWFVGKLFASTFASLTTLTGLAPYQLGAIAGFFGTFVRGVATIKEPNL